MKELGKWCLFELARSRNASSLKFLEVNLFSSQPKRLEWTSVFSLSYVKVQCRGHGETPTIDQVAVFIRICKKFSEKHPDEVFHKIVELLLFWSTSINIHRL